MGALNSSDTITRLNLRALVLALLVGAFVILYPQLDAMGYCDKGGCPEVSQSSGTSGSAMGGSASHTGTGGGAASGVGHSSDAQGAGSAGIAPLAVLAAAPAYLFSRLFLVLEAPPGPRRPASLVLPPDSPPPIS